MEPEQIKANLDRYFFLSSVMITKGKPRRILIYSSPSGVELFRIEMFHSLDDGWRLGSITHTLSSQLEQLNSVATTGNIL